MTSKGPGEATTYDGSALRIGIVHTRWNTPIVSALVEGAQKALAAAGVPASNIITQSVPGSYELPFAVQRMYSASTSSSGSGLVSAATDLLGSGSSSTDLSTSNVAGGPVTAGRKGEVEVGQNKGPLDAIIAIGVLIKGSTMHFEYIADATTHGLMRVQLDMGVPVVFGVLTCLTEEQAFTRAGLKGQGSGQKTEKEELPSHAKLGVEGTGDASQGLMYGEQGHNHGEDWGQAAVEMAVKRRGWGEGRFVA